MKFNCAKYLCGESAEMYIPVPDGFSSAIAMQRITSHACRLRRCAKCKIIYACCKDGKGLRLIHVLLNEPVKKKQRGRHKGVKNKPATLELLEYMEENNV